LQKNWAVFMKTWISLAVLAALAMTADSVESTDRLSMRVSPSVSFAPANLVVQAVVEANKDNRAIEVVADSEEFYRRSEIQLDGDRAPRTTRLEFHSVPSGQYQVRVVLRGSHGEELASTEAYVNVVATGVR
jgi:hypothetical protein